MGMNPNAKRKIDLDKKWSCYSYNHDGSAKEVPVILIEHGPKNMAEVKQKLRAFSACITLLEERSALFLKTPNSNQIIPLESNEEHERVSFILSSSGIEDAATELDMMIGITKSIESIQTATADFDNRGIFSTHYLRNRLFEDVHRDLTPDVASIKPLVGAAPGKILKALGWNKDNNEQVSIVITEQNDFSIRSGSSDVAPSYTAISHLKQSKWVILTNGKRWRLYTSNISASSTNYFEINLDVQRDSTIRYLVAIFGAATFEEIDDKRYIDEFFAEGKKYATDLEEDLASRIMSPDGLFLDIIKGVLNHDMKTKFTAGELGEAKETALKILYRVWFLAYAESRNLLPTKDEKYRNIALQTIRDHLDLYEDPHGHECWDSLCILFKGIREGSREHNLPQYNGDLFSYEPSIDGITIKNHFIVDALHSLLERDGVPMDYASLGVRHLGNIFESLMEFGVKQTDHDIMLLEDKKGVREVASKAESTYSYKKNDLYLASKGGMIQRKTTASFYTPNEVVEFLVKQGLQPIFTEREKLLDDDIRVYEKSKTTKNMKSCMDRLLDIQVLDPAMGSGHFLVETLNQITQWVIGVLDKYPNHPLLSEIEYDRSRVLTEQEENGIAIDESLLTNDVLLKRKVMKRCIFGVDLNPLAVELAKLSLWLDSFAIGVPLTFMDHHIKNGDSTIGVMLNELETSKSASLDNWIQAPERFSKYIDSTAYNTDINMSQVWDSKNSYAEYQSGIRPHKVMLDAITAIKMDKDVVPARVLKHTAEYLMRLANTTTGKTNPDKELNGVLEQISKKQDSYKFFHYELDMMDAFTDQRRGFDLIIGNPPWNKIRPNANEFFTSVDYNYKKKSNNDKIAIRKKFDKEYQQYKAVFDEKRAFYKNHGGIGENTDFDIYRIMIERMLQVLTPGGVFSMLMPSAIVNSRGATALRKYILEKNILSLYVFQNKYKIFPIHSSQRFALLTFQNSDGSDEFSCGFYLHRLASLKDMSVEKDKFRTLSKFLIYDMSSEMTIIPEIKSDAQLHIIQKIATKHPKLGNTTKFSVDLGRELNMGESKDKKLLVSRGGWPVLESKNFHQHIHNYSKPIYRADIRKTLARVKTKRKFHGKSKEIHENPRLVYRSITASDNTRTMIACIIPQSVFTTIGAYMALSRIGTFEVNPNYHRLNAYLCGIFNSTTFDFLIRTKIDKNVETYHLYDTPIPENFTSDIAQKISKLCAILTLSETWHGGMANAISISKDDVNNRTLNHRIDLVARIDALVALQYGLTHDEYESVLKDFKVDNNAFTKDELTCVVDYTSISKAARDKHMRRFYRAVYERALNYYDMVDAKSD